MDTIKKNELIELIKRHVDLVNMKALMVMENEGEMSEKTIEDLKKIDHELAEIRKTISEIAPEFDEV